MTMTEVVPKLSGIEEVQFLLLITEQLPEPPVVEQEPPIFVDDTESGGTKIQNFAKLALLLRQLAPVALSAP